MYAVLNPDGTVESRHEDVWSAVFAARRHYPRSRKVAWEHVVRVEGSGTVALRFEDFERHYNACAERMRFCSV